MTLLWHHSTFRWQQSHTRERKPEMEWFKLFVETRNVWARLSLMSCDRHSSLRSSSFSCVIISVSFDGSIAEFFGGNISLLRFRRPSCLLPFANWKKKPSLLQFNDICVIRVRLDNLRRWLSDSLLSDSTNDTFSPHQLRSHSSLSWFPAAITFLTDFHGN